MAHRLAGAERRPTDLAVEVRSHTAGGYSNEILFVDATYRVDGAAREDRLVLRLPPDGPALFPTYDLTMQVAVQEAVGAHGIPVPSPVTVEADASWLGSPFLVMPRIDGHDPGELPVADARIGQATDAEQRALHENFVDILAQIHTTPWRDRPFTHHLRGVAGTLDDEVAWWEELARWTFDGDLPPVFADLFRWCRGNRPTADPPSGVLWGDVRLGNVLVDDRFVPIAVLDWEMASIGPAELDIGWLTALETMAAHFVGRTVPGFLTRDEIIDRHQAALGRSLVDMEWFERFALCRSSVLQIRADRLESLRRGKAPRPPERNAVLGYTLEALG